MDYNLFKKIIDEASQIGIKTVHLYLHGESFLHPNILDMIKYIKSKNQNINIATNGMLFNPEKIKEILKLELNSDDVFRFSILGYSKEVHEKIMKGVNHEIVLKNVNDFLELRKKSGANGPINDIFFLTIPENIQEKKQFIKHWSPVADHVESWSASKSFWRYKGKIFKTAHRKKTCRDLWGRMTIFWNGEVTICCQDVNGKYIIGNLNSQSISEVWNGKKMMSILKIHKKKQFQKIPICKFCDFF